MRRRVRYVPWVIMLVMVTGCVKAITPEPTATPQAPDSQSAAPVIPVETTVPITTLEPLPPAATATPTPTSEPLVHVVESGDTLFGIAFEYNVDPEALQAANNIDDPQRLQLGQRLVIPQGDVAVESAPASNLPTPTPMPFEVQGMAFYETPVGSLWCLGEVVNSTDQALTNVVVNVALFDASGQFLVQSDVFVAADLIASGGRSPFGVLFTSPPAEWSSSQVTIMRGDAAGALSADFVPLQIAESEGNLADGRFRVSGIIQNASADQSAGTVAVIATTYDDEGAVTGFRQFSPPLDAPVAPGETVSFELLFTFHGEAAPANYNIIALGRVPAG